jgi:hypothetical protein
MKKINLYGSFMIILSLLFLPSITMAAYNDVTLTTSAVISVGGYTLNVTGSSAVVQSITVNTSNFTVTLVAGSSIKISSPSVNEISSDIASDVTTSTCNNSESSITLSYFGNGAVTNTITPSSIKCANSSSISSGSSGYVIAPQTKFTCTPVTNAPTASFTKDLSLKSDGNDVQSLQIYLNTHGFIIATTGPGSPGKETTYFGLLTQKALVKFQKANNITPAVGYFGPKTRKFISLQK